MRVPAAVARLGLGARAEVFRAELDLQRRTIARLKHRRVPTVFWLEVDYQHAILAAEEHWITQLLVDLESGAVDWDERTPPLPSDGEDAALITTTPLYPDLPARKDS